jgi:hypothetical protein
MNFLNVNIGESEDTCSNQLESVSYGETSRQVVKGNEQGPREDIAHDAELDRLQKHVATKTSDLGPVSPIRLAERRPFFCLAQQPHVGSQSSFPLSSSSPAERLQFPLSSFMAEKMEERCEPVLHAELLSAPASLLAVNPAKYGFRLFVKIFVCYVHQ